MKAYLYLAKRDKKSIQLLAVVNTPKAVHTKVDDVKQLGLPASLESQIADYLYKNRMLFELWVESAESYNELKTHLKNRGFQDLPFGASPVFQYQKEKIVSKVEANKKEASIKPLESKQIKSMLRRIKE